MTIDKRKTLAGRQLTINQRGERIRSGEKLARDKMTRARGRDMTSTNIEFLMAVKAARPSEARVRIVIATSQYVYRVIAICTLKKNELRTLKEESSNNDQT